MRTGDTARHTGPSASDSRHQADPQQHVEDAGQRVVGVLRAEQRRHRHPDREAEGPPTASAQRVTGASTTVVTHGGSARPGLSGSNRGFRHASATTAKVNVNAHAAPMSA